MNEGHCLSLCRQVSSMYPGHKLSTHQVKGRQAKLIAGKNKVPVKLWYL